LGIPKQAVDGVADDFRLEAMIPTFELLLSQMAKVVVIGHVNRPGGQVIEEQRVAPVVDWFSQRFNAVKYAKSIVGMEARQSVLALQNGKFFFWRILGLTVGKKLTGRVLLESFQPTDRFLSTNVFRAHTGTTLPFRLSPDYYLLMEA